MRIGQDADWLAAFAEGFASIGVKRDGSLWKWGGLQSLPDGTRLMQRTAYATPVRWGVVATNLVSFHTTSFFDLAVFSDGSVQTIGLPPRGIASHLAWQQTWLHTIADWRDLALSRVGSLVALKRDRTLWHQDSLPIWPGQSSARPSQTSAYSDWLTVSACGWSTFLALAADGTISCWDVPAPYLQWGNLLAPTRRPLWSLNIFDAAK